MQRLVVFIGVVGSGKDYRANELMGGGFFRVDFKDALLEMASDLCGYDVRSDYEWFKLVPVGVRRSAHLRNMPAEQMKFIVGDKLPGVLTGRTLLQRLGTDVMRKRDPQYWARQWQGKVERLVSHGHNVTCADCRFINEVRAVLDIMVDVRFVFCDYRSERYDATMGHESERLAQGLLKIGLKDGDEIQPYHFEQIHAGVI